MNGEAVRPQYSMDLGLDCRGIIDVLEDIGTEYYIERVTFKRQSSTIVANHWEDGMTMVAARRDIDCKYLVPLSLKLLGLPACTCTKL